MSELIAIRVTGESKLTLIDRATGRVELVDAEVLGLDAVGKEGSFVGLTEAYVFASPEDLSSRHRIQHA